MVLELFLLTFAVSFVVALVARKMIRRDSEKEIKHLQDENNFLRRSGGIPPKEREEMVREEESGWANNDVEGAVYDSNGKRIN